MRADCGHEMEPPGESVVAAGGWCAPKELLYEIEPKSTECSDCKTRMLMMLQLGIDPGRNGENLTVKRGGIQYRAHKERA